MATTELEKAFATLADAFSISEKEIGEEVKIIEQQIESLKDRIIELNGKQESLAHDRQTIEEMCKRHNPDE